MAWLLHKSQIPTADWEECNMEMAWLWSRRALLELVHVALRDSLQTAGGETSLTRMQFMKWAAVQSFGAQRWP
eukprot:11224956-Lingulodinium_polyedra.AAC.1